MRNLHRILSQAVAALLMACFSALGADPEFNPLPVTPLCPPVETLRRAVPLRDGTLILSSGSRVFRVNRNMELMADFNSPAFEGAPKSIIEAADGKLVVLIDDPNDVDFHLVRLLSDGQVDSSFASTPLAAIQGLALADDGKIYITVAGIIRRIGASGGFDPTFNSELSETFVHELVPGPNGTLYARSTGNGRPGILTPVSRLLESGAIDPSFAPFDSAGISRIGEFNYSSDARGFVRLATSGGMDPAFVPISTTGGLTSVQLDGTTGLFRFSSGDGISYEVNRFNLDGTPDTAYRRGTFQVSFASLFLASAGERDLYSGAGITTPGRDGIEVRCNYLPNFLRIELKPADARLVFEPGSDSFAENSAATFLTIVRTGDNTAPRTASYRIREGSARAGVDFSAEAEGELQFAEGISRLQIPITFLDNSALNQDRSFFLDLIEGEGATITTLPATIRNDDVGLVVVGQFGDELELIGFGGAAPWFHISKSSDITTWSSGPRAVSGCPVRVTIADPHAFFKARGAYSLTGR